MCCINDYVDTTYMQHMRYVDYRNIECRKTIVSLSAYNFLLQSQAGERELE